MTQTGNDTPTIPTPGMTLIKKKKSKDVDNLKCLLIARGDVLKNNSSQILKNLNTVTTWARNSIPTYIAKENSRIHFLIKIC